MLNLEINFSSDINSGLLFITWKHSTPHLILTFSQFISNAHFCSHNCLFCQIEVLILNHTNQPILNVLPFVFELVGVYCFPWKIYPRQYFIWACQISVEFACPQILSLPMGWKIWLDWPGLTVAKLLTPSPCHRNSLSSYLYPLPNFYALQLKTPFWINITICCKFLRNLKKK